MNSVSSNRAEQIKKAAVDLGFDACGIAKVGPVNNDMRQQLASWLQNGFQADMYYMERHFELRCDPRLLIDNAQSIIVTALNYFPAELQPQAHPQFAYYAYGKDYHDIIKHKLRDLVDRIKKLAPESENRVCVDTVPLAERYWAVQAGLGFIGRNTQLILPGKGSYFFIGSIVSTLDLSPDSPVALGCGNCRSCLDHCPAKALSESGELDARRCLSYQTIENRKELSPETISCLGNRVYGCDTCQQVCPWNRFAEPCKTAAFKPSTDFLALNYSRLQSLSEEEYHQIFKNSAVKRAKYQGLMRNIKAIKK